MLPKESYWVDKVIFSDTNSCHIIGHWNYEINTVKPIYVAANAAGMTSATLKVTDTNNTETLYQGVLSSTYLWTFDNVVWKEGTVSVEIKNASGTVLVRDSITSHGDPASIKITPITSESGLQANGSDVLLLDVEILDANGNRCETFDGVRDNIYTYFTVNNQAQNVYRDDYCVWRGGYNSSIQNSTNNKYLYIESGITRVALRTTMNAGEISVTATTTLENGTVLTDTYSITSTPVNNTNGYCITSNSRLTYNLDNLSYQTVGTGIKPTEQANPETTNNESSLIENLFYTGTDTIPIVLESVLENGSLMYNDQDYTFTSVPYKYMNAEYVRLPNTDHGVMAADLLNFAASENIDVLIFREIDMPIPSWMDVYVKTTDIVTGSNGVVYEIYKKSYLAGSGITIGSNRRYLRIGNAWSNEYSCSKKDITS